MEPIRIEDLKPKKAVFTLNHNDKKYHLKPCTPGIYDSVKKKLDVSFSDLLSEPNPENLSKMCMFLMEDECKTDFKKRSVKTIDELTGEEGKVDVGGYELLMHMMGGPDEQREIYLSVLETLGWDRKKASKFLDDANEKVNEKLNEDIKKNLT